MTEIIRKFTKQDIRNTMAMVWVFLSFYFIFALLKKPIPPENKDVVMTAVGLVLGQLVGIVNYFFGQSKSETDQKRVDNEKDN